MSGHFRIEVKAEVSFTSRQANETARRDINETMLTPAGRAMSTTGHRIGSRRHISSKISETPARSGRFQHMPAIRVLPKISSTPISNSAPKRYVSAFTLPRLGATWRQRCKRKFGWQPRSTNKSNQFWPIVRARSDMSSTVVTNIQIGGMSSMTATRPVSHLTTFYLMTSQRIPFRNNTSQSQQHLAKATMRLLVSRQHK